MRRMGTTSIPFGKTPLTKGKQVRKILRQKYTANQKRAKGEAFPARTWSRSEMVLAPISWAGTQALT